MNRIEHLAWCKKRALEYLEPGPHYSVQEAFTSMASDLSKHEENSNIGMFMAIGMQIIDENDMRKWINGFN